jgi:ketosteroid isomerase-like protein
VNAELEAAEQEWVEVIQRRDVDAADRLLATDFALSSIGGVGNQVSREEWLGSLTAIESTLLDVDVLESRVLGEVGIVRARLRWEATLGARDLTGDYAVTDVFKREKGRWLPSWRISVRLSNE